MTLHWWMHWFWVTAQLAVIVASPLPSTTEVPKLGSESSGNLTEPLNPASVTSGAPYPRLITGRAIVGREDQPEFSTRASFRVAKAIGSYDLPNTASVKNNNRQASGEASPLTGETSRGLFSTTGKPLSDRNWSGNPGRTRTSPGNMIHRQAGPNSTGPPSIPPIKRDSRITWVITTGRTPVRRRTDEAIAEDIIKNFSSVSQQEEKDLTVLPLRGEATRFKLVVNRSRTITANNAGGFSTRTFNGSEDIEIDQELAEPRLAATAASILQGGISESTRLSRARNTFSRDFERDRAEDRTSEIDVRDIIVENESVNAEMESSTPSAIDIAAITGSCLATVVLLSTMASLGFIMYRRKYLNPPQTLNSDKCSNPDSSGYIDDSTIRDNSEEMYSLDNDSFLNSLEAMTIQNYWTDSVKHTKL